jgi:hypothetical protein
MRYAVAIRSFLFSLVCLAFSHGSFGQIAISVSFGPPALPVYEQPICPEEGYIWTPGFWAYDDEDGYYWVPGTWVLAPEPGFLWTPSYWGWSDEGVFIFHEAIGESTSAFMAVLVMATATSGAVTTAVAGTTGTFTTTRT